MNSIANSLRISILVPDENYYSYFIIDPKKDDEKIYFVGRLDNNADGYYDFKAGKENDERSFDEICDEALKLFKSQCDNIHFKAIDDRDVELISDDNGHNKYNVIIIEHFRLLQSRHTTYKSMSQELYKYCVQYLHDMAKKYGYVIIVGMHINNAEEWLNN